MLEHIRDKVLGLKEEERRKFYSACFSFPSSQALGFSELMEIIQKIPSRDEVRIFLSLENEDPFIIVKIQLKQSTERLLKRHWKMR